MGKKRFLGRGKGGQVTIFIILAIVIVVGIVLFFSFRPSFRSDVPEDMRPIYDYYISCMESVASRGVSILGEQGGYIDVPDFEAGSPYSPFSSQLDFFGQGVPYWLYLSGNNFLKEQVPTKSGMEEELDNYIASRQAGFCDFSEFEQAGYDIYIEDGEVSSSINDETVDVVMNNKVTIFRDGDSTTISSHKFSLSSRLGAFFDMASNIFEKEKSTMFLEEYAVDVLRNYAPVDGVDISCVPEIFVDEEIRQDIYGGLEANMNAIKFDGSYYELLSEDNKYFVVDADEEVDFNVNVMYNSDWTSKIDIEGDRIVQPVGLQEGLSAIGFCYVPYHLVYDIYFPVMIQLFDSEELFQFPVAVIIDNNQPRENVSSSSSLAEEDAVCEYDNADVDVYTYDNELNPVAASLQFKCLDSICDIGETTIDGYDAVYSGGVPTCVNGFIVATSEGYAQGKVQVSTNVESTANILLKKKYEIGLEMDDVDDVAAVTFTGEDYSTTVLYPDMNTVELVEGSYNISVYVYSSSNIVIPGQQDRVCVDVPVEGIGAFFGLEEEKCYDIDIPSMDVEQAIVGGGSGVEYITESMLRDYDTLVVNAQIFGVPTTIEELQENYGSVGEAYAFLEFKNDEE